MKLYACWGTFPSPRPGGHPCRNAYGALRKAGWNPDVERVYGLGIGKIAAWAGDNPASGAGRAA
jgi:hypothetical protein